MTRLVALLCLVSLGAPACGSPDAAPRDLVVFAAVSLTEVFSSIEPGARFNFAGSDQLATQIREGARADVFAAASFVHPERLHRAGLVEPPAVFATNRLVLIVPAGNPAHLAAVADLRREGVKLVVGAAGVPIGDYTRTVLAALGASDVLDRVVSEEQDVKGVIGKVALGEADAGFVYATDVAAVREDVRGIELPADAQPKVSYHVAVVTGAPHPDEARAFVATVLGEEGRLALAAAGFGLP